MKTDRYSRWDWLSAALLLSAVFTAAVRLNTTDWTPDLGYVETLAVLGVIFGLAIGLSQFKRGTLFWLVIFYTLVIVPIYLRLIITGEKTALGQLFSLGGRLSASFGSLLNGKAVSDHIFFVVLMSILFWTIGIYSGYRLMRDRAIFQVLLPSTLSILVIQYYDGYKSDRIWGLAFYFFLALMLTGRINLLNSRDRWEEQGVVAGSDPEFDMNKNIVSVAAVIVLAAWIIPAPAAVLPVAASVWQNVNEPFQSVRKRLDDMLAALNSSRVNNAAREFYGEMMGLGQTAGSGETEFFRVRVPQNNLPRIYWRMRVYDTYQSGSWQTSNSQNVSFEPDTGGLVTSHGESVPVGEFVFTWNTSRSAMLVTPSQPFWVSRKGSMQTPLYSDGETDLLSWSVSPDLQTGDQYQVRALLPNPTQKELRNSGSETPAWITDRYLQIPENISVKYKPLAISITTGLLTNFDKAEAVTEYLRQNITYSTTVPTSPPGVDAMNWFLFDGKSGFCNYYASAEVLLLRSVGIPARMVVGFAQGKSGNYGMYSVSGQDAHAWPEVFFPTIGWVQFEPTVSQSALVRPSGAAPNFDQNADPRSDLADNFRNNSRMDQEEDDFAPGDTITFLGLARREWLWVIISSIILAVVGVFGWRIYRRDLLLDLAQRRLTKQTARAFKAIYTFYNLKSPPWLDRWVRWSEVSTVERSFHAINQALSWLGKPQPDYATPAERALLLKNLLPEALEDIDILSAALEKTLYTLYPADEASAVRAGWMLRFFSIRKFIQIKLIARIFK